MAETLLAKKLGIKPGYKLAILRAPECYNELLDPLPEGVTISDTLEGAPDFIQLFVKSIAEVDEYAPAVLQAANNKTLVWLCYPKGTSKIKTDISRDKGWDTVKQAGWDWATLISLDSNWSAFRTRPAHLIQSTRSPAAKL